MSIIRVEKDKGYFVASDTPFNDARLSWDARGVMGYLLSKPDNWQVRFDDLINQGDAKRFKMRRILKELETCGYLERKMVQDDKGAYDWISTVYEHPKTSTPTHGDSIGRKPTYGGAIGQSPTDGKPTYIVTSNKVTKLTKLTKNPVIDAETIEAFLKRVPESTRDLAEAFCTMHGRPPIKSEEKYWRKCWNEQGELGLTADCIVRAYHYMTANDLTIRSPKSLNAVAEKIMKDGKTFVPDNNNTDDWVILGDVKYPRPKSKSVAK